MLSWFGSGKDKEFQSRRRQQFIGAGITVFQSFDNRGDVSDERNRAILARNLQENCPWLRGASSKLGFSALKILWPPFSQPPT
jgi:hypothetical protein